MTIGALARATLSAVEPWGAAVVKLFDNINLELGPHLLETLKVSQRMDVAVGYFNLRGWSVFDEHVRPKLDEPGAAPTTTVRILIGMVAADPQRQALDDLQGQVDGTVAHDADGEAARNRKTQLLEQLRIQLMRGLPTKNDRATLRSLRDQLAAGTVQVKVHTRRPLHGKTYICHREDLNTPIIGFVGSSNLTPSGLFRNLELNVDVKDDVAAIALADWFEKRWDDKFSRPITAELLQLLDDSWARKELRRPYEVFMKVCYDMSRDVREGLAEYSIPTEINQQLLDFQATAVRALARRIMTKRGTMLGDVVGLGKTLTAVAVALMLREEHGYVPLVICSRNLVSMWKEHFDLYEIHGSVVTYSMAHGELTRLHPPHRFVIIDESHTLRNENRRDYQAVRDYIRTYDSKVLLLTATPYNIQFRDVANQLSLYIDDDDDLGIAPINALLNDPRIVDKVDSKITTMAAFRLSEDPDDWKRLMSEHLIRRTRTFIVANHSVTGADGRPCLKFTNGTEFRFPNREPRPIDHSFGPTDPAAIMASDTTLDTIVALRLPRYQLGRYLAPQQNRTADEQAIADNLIRGGGQVAGFVRTSFYKRLSSGGYAFTLSLQRHIARNELFSFAIDNSLPIPIGTIVDTNLLDDEDETSADLARTERLSDDPARRYTALQAAAPKAVTWVRPSLFTAALRQDLAADTASLQRLLDSFGGWTAERDSKLAALITLLTDTHPDEKILIFSEFKDTANYVAESLRNAGIDKVGLATGDVDDPTGVAHRFSPVSNAHLGGVASEVTDELRVLASTDVLSEGQNLQDAHIIVNYDLPWAIIRLIQRAGRVDRIGQKADTVVLYSFFHESVDNVLDLRRRISNRLSANAAAFGSDEQFFGSDGEVKAITDLYNGTLDEQAGDDVDASSLAYQLWRRPSRQQPPCWPARSGGGIRQGHEGEAAPGELGRHRNRPPAAAWPERFLGKQNTRNTDSQIPRYPETYCSR